VADLGLIPARNSAIGKAADIDLLVRSILLAAVLLALWISFRPFPNLADALEFNEAGSTINQVGYSFLFLLLAAWCMTHRPGRLVLLIRPILLVTLFWLALTVVASWEPPLAARRLAFTLIVIGMAGMALLVPRNVRHFSEVLMAVVLIVLAVCYISIFLIPSLSIQQVDDIGGDYGIVGDWRGVFNHKNAAGATMALFVLIGFFIARSRSAVVGTAIIVLAATFLYFTHSKTSIITLPLTLIVSLVMARGRRPMFGVFLVLLIVVALNVFSVGSIFFEPIRNLLDRVMADPSFTGRDEVWQFAFAKMMQRPFIGYGFAAFWNTPQVIYGPTGDTSWATVASSAHNAYLDLALTVGIPGAILVTLWLVVTPIIDFYRSRRAPGAGPLEMLFLRVCLITAFSSCFESGLLQEGEGSLFLLMSAFGLRFLSVSRMSA
jgi:O-antigen ligase